jgi:type III pantothenate kinase
VICAVLIGNTTIRHALIEGENVLSRGVVEIPAPGTPLPDLKIPPDAEIDAVVVGSVNPQRLEEALVGLREVTARVLVAGLDFPIPIVNRYKDPSQVGADRLLNALAASKMYPGQGVVVLDFGTALSVSVVSPSGEFLGGPIAAGIRSVAAGLALRTAQLPRVDVKRPPGRLLATSTEEALRAGIHSQVAGAATWIIDRLAAEVPFPLRVIATGGDADPFAPLIPRIEAVDEDLAFKGLALAHSVHAG